MSRSGMRQKSVPPDVILNALNGMMSAFAEKQAHSAKKRDKKSIREREQ